MTPPRTIHRCLFAGTTLVAIIAFATASSAASAETLKACNTEQLEKAITKANANTEANTIELCGGTYLPGPKTLVFKNTSGPQTIVGPTTAPGAKIEGTNIETENPELLRVNEGVALVLRDVLISHAGGNGGVSPGVEVNGTLTVEQSTLAGDRGSSVLVEPSGSATITNSTLSDGSADGLVIAGGSAALLNDTIVLNKGGGIDNSGTLEMTNTIVAENGPPDCEGTAATVNDHNLDGDGTCGAELTGKPKLGALALNGAGVTVHAVLPGSPAIEAADASKCPTVDESGHPRPAVSGKPCSIGADEYSAVGPEIIVPSELDVKAEGPTGAIVKYTAEAKSTSAGIREFKCTPPPETTFPVGKTTVECTAKDGHENVSTKSFVVDVEEGTTSSTTTTSSSTTTPTTSSVTTTSSTSTTSTSTTSTTTPVTSTTTSSSTTTPTSSTTSTTTSTPTTSTTSTASTTTSSTSTTTPTTTTTSTTTPTTSSTSTTTSTPTTSTTSTVSTTTSTTSTTTPTTTTSTTTSSTKTAPPELHGIEGHTVKAEGPSGAHVTYEVTATDPNFLSSELTVECLPPSGSLFPVGSTEVKCIAKDPAGNETEKSFTVTVEEASGKPTPEAELKQLLAEVEAAAIPMRLKERLEGLLDDALAHLGGGLTSDSLVAPLADGAHWGDDWHSHHHGCHCGAAVHDVESFIEVVALESRGRRPEIPPSLAAGWIRSAESVLAALACDGSHHRHHRGR